MQFNVRSLNGGKMQTLHHFKRFEALIFYLNFEGKNEDVRLDVRYTDDCAVALCLEITLPELYVSFFFHYFHRYNYFTHLESKLDSQKCVK